MTNPIHNLKRTLPLAGGVAGVLCLLATVPAGAAIVTIDLSSAGTGWIDITGVNAGMTYAQAKRTVVAFVPGGDLDVYCGFSSTSGSPVRQLGLDGDGDLQFAVVSGRPLQLTAGQTVDGSLSYSGGNSSTTFYYTDGSDTRISGNFGPNRFMGFRFGSAGNRYYGYIEVLWNWTGDPATSTFQLLSAAYQSQINTGIAIPSPVAVPGAGLAGLATIGLAGVSRRRRR
jgi:hypothetical protein